MDPDPDDYSHAAYRDANGDATVGDAYYDRHCHAHRDCDLDPHADTHTNGDGDTHTNKNRIADDYAVFNIYCDANIDLNSFAHSNGDANTTAAA